MCHFSPYVLLLTLGFLSGLVGAETRHQPAECSEDELHLPETQMALYEAVLKKDLATTAELLQGQPDVGFIGPDGRQPLHRAVLHDSLDLVRLLLAAGADPNEVDCSGLSVLEIAAYRGEAEITLLLLDSGADPNHVGARSRPIDAAISSGHVAIGRLLLERGADPNIRAGSVSNWPPLFTAIFYSQAEMVALLLQAGADPNTQLATGETALFRAIGCLYPYPAPEQERLPVVKLLLSYGADPNIKTRNTPLLACARHQGATRIESLLIDAGAHEYRSVE